MARLDDYSFRHDGCIYTFAIMPELAEFKSKLEGRKVFKDTEVLRIRIPSPHGIPKQENCDEVTEDLLQRYGIEGEYANWKAGERAVMKGAPLTELEDLSQAQIKTLEASGVPTCEALIEVDGALLSKVIGPTWRDLVEKAKVVTGFTVDEGVKALRADNATMKDELDALKIKMADLMTAKTDAAKAPKNRTEAA